MIDTSINYSQAIQLLGLKPGFSKEELRKRYVELAKKYHPDVAPSADKVEFETRMKNINEAIAIIKKGPVKIEQLNANVRPYYILLKKMIPPNIEPEVIDDIFGEIIMQDKYRNDPGAEESMAMAKDRLVKDYEGRRYLAERARNAMRKRYANRVQFYAAATNEERKMILIDQLMKEENQRMFLFMILNNFDSLVKRMVTVKKKSYVPIKVEVKRGKSHTRLILVTISLIIAILGGKYVWDKAYRAYQMKKSSRFPLVRL